MICKKFLQVSSNNINSNLSFNFDADTKKVYLVSTSGHTTSILPLGTLKDENDPDVDITLIGGEGISISQDNSINVDIDWLDSVINNKGFITIDAVPTKVSQLNNDTGYLVVDDLADYAFISAIPTGLNSWRSADNRQYISDIGFVLASELPTKVSDFENDVGYLTVHQDLSEYAKLIDIPTSLSAFTNEPGYLTEHQDLSDYATKDELLVNGTGLTITDGVISIDNDFLSGFVANLGYVKVEDDQVCSADEETILMTGERVLSVNSTWLGNFVDAKLPTIPEYTATSGIVLDGTEFSLDLSYARTNVASGYLASIPGRVQFSERLVDSLGNSDVVNKLSEVLSGVNIDVTTGSTGGGPFTKYYTVLSTAPVPTKVSDLENDTGFITGYVDTLYSAGEGLALDELNNVFSLTAAIPTKVSELENDSEFITSADIPTDLSAFTNSPGYLTEHQDLSNYAQTSALPTKVSELLNDTGFITGYVNTTYEAGTNIEITGDNNTINCTLTGLSQLVNDTGFVTDDNFLEAATYVKAYPDDEATGGYTEVNENLTPEQVQKAKLAIWVEDDEVTTAQQLIDTYGNRFQRYLKLTFAVKDNQGNITDENLVFIDVNELFDGYTAGNGIKIEDNEISLTASIPSAVSELENDTGFITGYVDTTYTAGLGLKLDDTEFSLTAHIPVNVSELNNDTGYITGYVNTTYTAGLGLALDEENNVFSLTAVIPTVPTNVAAFENDAEYATTGFVVDKIAELDQNTEYTAGEGLKLDGNEFSLTAFIPTKVSEIENDTGFITGIVDNALISDIPTGVSQLENDAEYITSAAIPTGVAAFANDAGYLTAAPSKVSELNNDKGFVTIAELEAVKATLLQYMNPSHVMSYQTIDGNINDPNRSIYIEQADVLTSNTTFNGKNITVQELNFENSNTSFTSTGDVTISNMNNSGTLAKAVSNAQVIVNTPGRVVITDGNLSLNGYNAIEIGLASATEPPKSVLIDGITFAGNLSNNAISIFGTADDAVVTISNCTFTKVSNVLRLSNRTNTKVTVNFVNCLFTEWDTGAYAGIVICQDYTSQTAAMVEQNNLFAPDKVTINLINCTHAGTKIEFDDPSTVCATGDANQLLYVYADRGGGLVAYDVDKFPTFTAV